MQYSVLMSVYEKEQPLFFRESLQSILRQSLPPAQIVVVCDGRLTNELYEVLTEMQAEQPALFTVVQLEKQGGLGLALNQGMQYCKNEIIARMDSDDISLPDRMKWQIEAMETHKADLISGAVEEFETDPSVPGKIRKLPVTQEEILRFARRRNPFNHPCVMYKKSVVLAAGGYQSFEGFEDYYLWLRMLSNGARGYNMDRVILFMRTKGMYQRRGGLHYAKNVIRFRNYMFRNGFCSLQDYLVTVCGHVIVSLMPDKMRKLFYNNVLRRG